MDLGQRGLREKGRRPQSWKGNTSQTSNEQFSLGAYQACTNRTERELEQKEEESCM